MHGSSRRCCVQLHPWLCAAFLCAGRACEAGQQQELQGLLSSSRQVLGGYSSAVQHSSCMLACLAVGGMLCCIVAHASIVACVRGLSTSMAARLDDAGAVGRTGPAFASVTAHVQMCCLLHYCGDEIDVCVS